MNGWVDEWKIGRVEGWKAGRLIEYADLTALRNNPTWALPTTQEFRLSIRLTTHAAEYRRRGGFDTAK